MTSIAVYYSFFPHYRKAVVRKLSERCNGNVFFFGDTNGDDGIVVMDMKGLKYTITTRLKFFSCEYHFGVVKNSIFGKQDAHIFLANPKFLSTWIAAFVCRVRNKKVIFWGHGYLHLEKNLFLNKTKKIFFGLSNIFLCYSDRAVDLAKESGANWQNWVSIGNSLDVDVGRVRELMSEHVDKPKNRNFYRVLAISRLTRSCQYELLIEAVRRIQESSDFEMTIRFIGEGPELEVLKEMSKKLGVNCEFLGAIYDDLEISKYMLDCDLAVSPGKVGLTAIHCLANGIPIITHGNLDYQMPEVEVVKEGITGYFFERNSVESLVCSILRAVETNCLKWRVSDLCFDVIQKKYNADWQAKVIFDAIRRC